MTGRLIVGSFVALLMAACGGNHGASSAASTPTSPSTPPSLQGVAAEKALNELAANPSRIRNGCADVEALHVCVPALQVDGHAVAPTDVMSPVLNAATSPTGSGPSAVSSPQVIDGAVALVVLDELLASEAAHDGIVVTHDQAAAFAQQALAMVERDPASAQAAGVVPAGQTAQSYFSSPKLIAGYQHVMTIGQEKAHILQAAPPGSDHRSVLARWLGQVLPGHRVLLDGRAPTFSIPDALPAQL